MRQYIVEPGDTLAGIAQRLLGSAGKWSVLAEINDLHDPDRLRPGQKLTIPDKAPAPMPSVVEPSVLPTTDQQPVTFTEEAGRVYANDPAGGERHYLGTKVRQGLRRYGVFQPEDFLQSGAQDLVGLQLSTSEINVLLSTAENEGALDAINTWDNSFLSFGMFQWTAGQGSAAGELAALLALVRGKFPDAFERYWGQYRLGVEGVQGAYGWLSLEGNRLRSAEDKVRLRDYHWVLRFVLAGADRRIQSMQVLHAVRRLDTFYFRTQSLLDGYSLSQLVTSEYGVALLLDNHVNRPGYLIRTVAEGIKLAQLTPARVVAGDTDTERRLLQKYLLARETYGRSPMTSAYQRAEVTRGYLVNGIISDGKGSFHSNRDRRAPGN